MLDDWCYLFISDDLVNGQTAPVTELALLICFCYLERPLFDDMRICTSIVLVMTISTFKKLVPRLVLVVKPLQSLPQPVAPIASITFSTSGGPGEEKAFEELHQLESSWIWPCPFLGVFILSAQKTRNREEKKTKASHCQPSHTQNIVATKDNLLDKKTPSSSVFVSDILSDNK